MTYLPSKARSEFVLSTKSLDGGVFDRRRIFHDAWPASNNPPLRPTRGSGLGGVGDMLTPAAAVPGVSIPLDPVPDAPECAHAPTDNSAIASDTSDVGRVIELRS